MAGNSAARRQPFGKVIAAWRNRRVSCTAYYTGCANRRGPLLFALTAGAHVAMATTIDTFGEQVSAALATLNQNFPSKCQHGVYIGIHDRTAAARAPYCTACSPDGPAFETRNVHLPERHRAGLQANKKTSDGCPACGESTSYELKNGKRECSECGKAYTYHARQH